MARTIQSPGVEVNEIDLSLRPIIPTGTSVLIPGFAHQGPTDEVFEITSLSEFITVYGAPTNPAERYFHHTVKSVFSSDARVLTTRLPYGSAAGLGFGDVYTALFYPVYPYNTGDLTITQAASSTGVSLSAATGGYIFGKPQLVELGKDEYVDLQSGNFNWQNTALTTKEFTSAKATWGHSGIVITNKLKAAINNKYEGYYVGLIDNSQHNPATDYDGIVSHVSVSENSKDLSLTVSADRRNFPLSGTSLSNDNSISEKMENQAPFDISTSEFQDTLTLGLFKLRTSVFSTDAIKLDFVLSESYIGSLDSYRLLNNPNGGAPSSLFLGNLEDSSPNIEVLVNPNISVGPGTWIPAGSNAPSKAARILTQRAIRDAAAGTEDTQGYQLSANFGVQDVVLNDLEELTSGGLAGTKAFASGDVLVPLGPHHVSNPLTKIIGSVPTKLSRIFRSLENLDLVNIDVSVEAGLGTVFAGSEDNQTNGDGSETFDDERVVDIGTVSSDGTTNTGLYQLKETLDSTHNAYNIQQNYRAVWNEFLNFAEFKRKDHIFVADAPRWIFVQGRNKKVLNDKTRTFTQFVYWPLKHIFGFANTSFSSTYANWGRVYDSSVDRQIWAPFSGTVAATYANNDTVYAPWWAPAGFTRGRFVGINDLAVLPTQKHRDQLYKISINPVHQFPNEGMVIWGQKTMFKKPSAFDRINVRRLFLYLEKLVRRSMKFYVFEPNTLLTRTQVVNNLTPPFEYVKNTEGMYDFLIICDERNNTPDRIDQNELIVDIYIKPVRAAEFILVNFYATRTGQDFSELTY
jgi:hypothetical protein